MEGKKSTGGHSKPRPVTSRSKDVCMGGSKRKTLLLLKKWEIDNGVWASAARSGIAGLTVSKNI